MRLKKGKVKQKPQEKWCFRLTFLDLYGILMAIICHWETGAKNEEDTNMTFEKKCTVKQNLDDCLLRRGETVSFRFDAGALESQRAPPPVFYLRGSYALCAEGRAADR